MNLQEQTKEFYTSYENLKLELALLIIKYGENNTVSIDKKLVDKYAGQRFDILTHVDFANEEAIISVKLYEDL